MKDKPALFTVTRLQCRPEPTAKPIDAQELLLHNRKGIFGDCHAHTLSPRQVLIVLESSYGDLNLPAGSLKENILISDTDVNELQSGDTLSLDDGRVELRITFSCEPCGRLNNVRHNLCRDIKGRRGYLARVVSSGPLRLHDHLHLTKNVYPAFSEDWRERVLSVARLLPPDHFLSYSKLALLAGVAKSYCRAFPRLLRSNGLLHKHIVASADVPPTHHEWNGFDIFRPEELSEAFSSLPAARS